MTKRINYREPEYVSSARHAQENPHSDAFLLDHHLEIMIKRHNELLRQLHITVQNYNLLLETYGPHHEIELGEPLARFSEVIRRGVSENE